MQMYKKQKRFEDFLSVTDPFRNVYFYYAACFSNNYILVFIRRWIFFVQFIDLKFLPCLF